MLILSLKMKKMYIYKVISTILFFRKQMNEKYAYDIYPEFLKHSSISGYLPYHNICDNKIAKKK